MSYERCDIVIAADPFRDSDRGRPFVIINTDETPFHGEQYIALALTTRTWHDERISLGDDDWDDGAAPARSSIMPWSITSVKHKWIDTYQGRLRSKVVDRAATALIGWIRPSEASRCSGARLSDVSDE